MNPVTMTTHDTDYGTGGYSKNWMSHPSYGMIGDMVQADDGTIYATYQKELLTYEMYVGVAFNIHDPAFLLPLTVSQVLNLMKMD